MNYKLASGRCCPKFITENRKVFFRSTNVHSNRTILEHEEK